MLRLKEKHVTIQELGRLVGSRIKLPKEWAELNPEQQIVYSKSAGINRNVLTRLYHKSPRTIAKITNANDGASPKNPIAHVANLLEAKDANEILKDGLDPDDIIEGIQYMDKIQQLYKNSDFLQSKRLLSVEGYVRQSSHPLRDAILAVLEEIEQKKQEVEREKQESYQQKVRADKATEQVGQLQGQLRQRDNRLELYERRNLDLLDQNDSIVRSNDILQALVRKYGRSYVWGKVRLLKDFEHLQYRYDRLSYKAYKLESFAMFGRASRNNFENLTLREVVKIDKLLHERYDDLRYKKCVDFYDRFCDYFLYKEFGFKISS